MGLYQSDDGSVMKTTHETLVGKVMSAWWDRSEEAGPKTRPNCQFSVPLPALDVLALTDGKLKTLGLQRFYLYTFDELLKNQKVVLGCFGMF